MNAKNYLKSKTLWINVLGGIVATAGLLSGVIPAKYAPLITAIGGIANIVLRLVTSQPLTMGATDEHVSIDGRGAALVLVLAVAGLALPGCAIVSKTVNVQAAKESTVQVANRIEHGLVTLQDLEIAAERGALIVATDAAARREVLKTHISMQQQFKNIAHDVRHVSDVAGGLATDVVPLGQLVAQLADAVSQIAADIVAQYHVSHGVQTAIDASVVVIKAAVAVIAGSGV